MKKFEIYQKQFHYYDDDTSLEPVVKGLSFGVQVVKDNLNGVRAEMYIEGPEYEEFRNSGSDYQKLAEKKMTEMLDLNYTSVDAHMLEGIKREVKAASESAGATKQAAIEAATAEMEKAAANIVEEATTQATQKAQEVVGKQVTQLGVEIEKATAAVAQIDILRTALRKFVRIDELHSEDIADLVGLYEPWKVDETLEIGDIRSYEDKLYKVVQAHTTQADWTPPATPALWTELAPPVTEDGEEIVPEWKQPTGAHDAYNIGDKVLFGGNVYESLIDGNSWSPSDYPRGWKEVTD